MSRTVGWRASWSHPARLKTRRSKALDSDLLPAPQCLTEVHSPKALGPNSQPLEDLRKGPNGLQLRALRKPRAHFVQKDRSQRHRGIWTHTKMAVPRTARILDHISKRVNFFKDASPTASSSMLMRSWEAGGHSESGTMWGSLSFAFTTVPTQRP